MRSFKVWDTLNCEQEDASTIVARGSMEAAIHYAESDHDGWTDGLYHETAQPIAVFDGHSVVTWGVRAELVPHFRADEEPTS